MEQTVEKYRKPTRYLHWVHAGAFLVLFFTGLILFVHPLGNILAQGGYTRIIHRIAAAVFIIAPLIYIPLNWKTSLKGIKEAFTWGMEDFGWLKAAPRYYFLADEEAMPPQGHMNTGQKMWWFMVIVFGLLFVVTGILMAYFKTIIPQGLMQWMVFAHDIAFVFSGLMFFAHVYMSAIHPLTRPAKTGAWNSMARGTVSVEYAKTHHAKWYAEISGSSHKK